jgi:hypothetical protein
VKAEMLSLLCAKSMGLELSSGNHDAVTPSDIAHFIGTKGLTPAEYDLLLAKYTENNYSRALFFDEIFEDSFRIFLKYVEPKVLRADKYIMRNFINLAIREVIYQVCFVCNGRGKIVSGGGIQECMHCNGTGQFIYDHNNRPEFLGMSKKDYKIFEKPYEDLLEMVTNIEINALNKIGDE